MRDRPNILLLYTDQERHNGWLPTSASVPARDRLRRDGMSFERFYTHTSPCSPSRATLFTGDYVTTHGVHENVRTEDLYLDPATTVTLGHVLRDQGYRTSYLGKWHLYPGATPPMEEYGFADWRGNDMAMWGLAGTGVEFDDPIATDAVSWLRRNGDSDEPWFLTAAFVNPHDIMWYPVDQPWYAERHPDHAREIRTHLAQRDWGRAENTPLFGFDYAEHFDELPPNFHVDLDQRPEVHRTFLQAHARRAGWLERDDTHAWLRQLDYYVKLHELNDLQLLRVLDALEATGRADDTVVIMTSDHGDQCGSHGLRTKGPWNYEETMRIPLYVIAPGLVEPGTTSDALTSTIDLAATIADLAGAADAAARMPGQSLIDVLGSPEATHRQEILFAQDWAWYPECVDTRYASRGFFDGRFKYCRYYGIGGELLFYDSGRADSGRAGSGGKRVGVDAPFDEHEHELYDLQEDPHELRNLAADPTMRSRVEDMFHRLLELEASEFEPAVHEPSRPLGAS